MSPAQPKHKTANKRAARATVWIVGAVLAVLVLALAFVPQGTKIRNVDQAGVEAARAKGAQIVDVRTAGEYAMGHIPGAINVPVDQLAEKAAGWSRDARYVIYCATGSRSSEAIKTLHGLGFKNLDHFSAGLQAYSGALEKGTTSASASLKTDGRPVFVEFYTDS